MLLTRISKLRIYLRTEKSATSRRARLAYTRLNSVLPLCMPLIQTYLYISLCTTPPSSSNMQASYSVFLPLHPSPIIPPQQPHAWIFCKIVTHYLLIFNITSSHLLSFCINFGGGSIFMTKPSRNIDGKIRQVLSFF